MPSDASLKTQRAILMILLAASERALEAFQAADNLADETFGDLERIIARTREELSVIGEQLTSGTA